MTPLQRRITLFSVLLLIILFIFSFFVTPHMLIATAAYGLLIIGLSLRKLSRTIHARIMSTAMFLDISLVLKLQIQRHAIQTAAAFSLSPLQQAHIGVSTLALILYFPTFYFGFKRLHQKGTSPLLDRKRHILFAVSAFIFRTLGFLFMFSMLDKSN